MAKSISAFAAAVNQNVRAEIARADIKDAELLATLGITRDTLATRRKGEREWTLGEIEKIAGLVEQSIDVLTRT